MLVGEKSCGHQRLLSIMIDCGAARHRKSLAPDLPALVDDTYNMGPSVIKTPTLHVVGNHGSMPSLVIVRSMGVT